MAEVNVIRNSRAAPIVPCRGCGREFSARMCGGERMRYCSRVCVDQHSRRVTAECEAIRRMGVRLRASRASVRRNRREAAMREITRTRYAASRPCVHCGALVVSAQAFGKPRDRCDGCRKVVIDRNNRASKARRRALERSATHATAIDPLWVLERDGWQCKLCGRDTPSMLRGTTDERAPEVDHVVPLSKGGKHEASNLQCACRRCNNEKGNRLRWTAPRERATSSIVFHPREFVPYGVGVR